MRSLVLRCALFALPAPVLLACPGDEPADDDDSAPIGDDDDGTPPPDPLADTIGVFNLINVVQPDGSSYVDLSGAFGTFAELDPVTLAPGGYLGGFSFGVVSWRYDLGGFPLPAPGQDEVVDLYAYLPYRPGEQTWWDGGAAVASGAYQAGRVTAETQVTNDEGEVVPGNPLVAYAVDDPLNPGAAGWTAGGTISFAVAGGPEVVAASFDGVPLPDEAQLTLPAANGRSEAPTAQDLVVRWNPQADGAGVSLVLLRGLEWAYVANLEDDGEHAVPAEVLHDVLGPGVWTLVLARDLETALPHPQGDLLVRTREEARATVELLPDLVVEPDFAEPGGNTQVDVLWFTGEWTTGTPLDFGEGIAVQSIFPDGSDPHRATVTLTVLPEAPVGARDVTVGAGDDAYTQEGAFWVHNLQPSDSCATADALPPLRTGFYSSSTEGLTNDIAGEYGCFEWSLNGADAIYPVDLLEGESMTAFLAMPSPGDGALILMPDCADPGTAVVCEDYGYDGELEVLEFTAPADGRWYLVVDAYTVAGYGAVTSPFQLNVQVGELDVVLLEPPWILPGETRTLEIPADTAWPGGIGSGDVDLGAGLTTGSVGPGSDALHLAVAATASAGAAPGRRDVTVDLGGGSTVTYPQGLWVTDWPAPDDCAEADAFGAITPGQGDLYAPGRTNLLDSVGCFGWDSPGPEVVLPVDIGAGEGLTVSGLSADDIQLYVLSSCGVPESCIPEASADAWLAGEAEEFGPWVPETPGRYYLVVDLFDSVPLDVTSAAWTVDLWVDVSVPPE